MNTNDPLSSATIGRRQVLQGAAALATLGPTALVHAQGDVWRIGQSASLTGPLAYPYVEMNKGIVAAFKEVNDRGGVDGQRIEFFPMDDGGTAEKAAENTMVQLKKNQVLTMFACGGTASVMGVLKVAMEAKVPLVAPGTGSDSLRVFNPLMFHSRASYGHELLKIARQLKSTGFTKVAIPYFDNPFGQATLAAFEAAAKATGNTEWKAFLVPETTEGVAKGIDEIAKFQPTSLISLAIGQLGIPLFKGLRARMRFAAFSISFLGSPPLLAALGDAAKGITVAQVVPNPRNPAIPVVKAYQDALKKYGSTEIGYSSLEGYVSARILIEGLRRAGRGASREKFIDALQSMHPYDMGGFQVNYSPEDHTGSDYVELTYFNGERFLR